MFQRRRLRMIHLMAQGFPGFEMDSLFGGHGNGSPGFGVTALPGGKVPGRKHPEVTDFDALSGSQGGFEEGEGGFHGFFHFLWVQVRGFLTGFLDNDLDEC